MKIQQVTIAVSMTVGLSDLRKQRRWLLKQEEAGQVEASGLMGLTDAIADAVLDLHPRLKLY